MVVQILELYLNGVYWGHGAVGVGDAAQVYFGKPPGALSLSEAALLAGDVAGLVRRSCSALLAIEPLDHPVNASK